MVLTKEATMNFKEHLQFLAMMIPTFVLLVAFAATLAFPGSGRPYTAALTHMETTADVQ